MILAEAAFYLIELVFIRYAFVYVALLELDARYKPRSKWF